MLKTFFAVTVVLLLALPSRATCKIDEFVRLKFVSQKTVALMKYQGSTYREVQALDGKTNQYFSLIYREKGGACYLSYIDPTNDGYSYSQGVPRPVAIAFAKVYIKTFISKFGKDKLVKKYNAYPQISPEEAEVLSQMGLLPKGIKVLPWATPQPEERIKS